MRIQRTAALLMVLLATAASPGLTPLGTGFTYQGQLRQSGSPVNGTVDLDFSLWNDPNATDSGNRIGSVQSIAAVSVSGGLFTVQLNGGGEFGPAAFNGDARWLQIEVRSPAGSGSFTTLAPRQPITAAPYALHAFNAGAGDGHSLDAADGNPVDALFVDNSGNVGVGTTSPGRRLDVNGSATVRGSMFFDTPGVLEVAHENNTGMRIDPASNSVQLETDGSIGLTLTSSRNVGIGTNSPLFPLHVETNSTSGRGVFGLASAASGSTYGVFGQSDSIDGIGAQGFASSMTGTTIGVWGTTMSPNGRGVYGYATGGSGSTTGVWGRSSSTSGRAVFGTADATSGVTFGGRFENDSTSGYGAFGLATSPSGSTFGLWGQSNSTEGFGVFGEETATSGTTYGLYGRSASTGGRGVFGYASAATGTTHGGYFQNQSTSGVGAFGYATATSGTTYGLFGQSDSTTGRGVYGLASTSSGSNYGVYGRSDSTSGYGVYGTTTAASGVTRGVSDRSDSTSGRGVYGYAAATSGFTYGGEFLSISTDGRGVQGSVTAATGSTIAGDFDNNSTSGIAVRGVANAGSGTTYGGYFQNNSPDGTGVFGLATATSGSSNTSGVYGRSDNARGVGVYGYASDTAGSFANFGVYGKSDKSVGRGVQGVNSNGGPDDGQYGVYGFSPYGYAVYGAGDMGASGTKSFRIDHPDDPENKYLLHYSVESPEVLNAYSGKVTLDGAGQSVVELPRYFAKINKDPRYTLTAIGAPMPNLHVAEEISEQALKAGEQAQPGAAPSICSFRIAGGVPSAKVSWEVKALRNDVLVRTRGTSVERDKTGPERGRYQHPELYGQPRERGMDYHEDEEAPPAAGRETAQN